MLYIPCRVECDQCKKLKYAEMAIESTGMVGPAINLATIGTVLVSKDNDEEEWIRSYGDKHFFCSEKCHNEFGGK